ncbi:hypothetical protein LAZ67_1003179 [Cordylochernes scorpioides]|uniref:Uncharacterized protein n=1 Tax=Cordylochernes scorpioides TaxID=51811 RepID=A0ABY6JYC0_9ARAC|nr:hypothetical protein LAZ67_1003179 [Cordylochernes scorpioides]
MKYKKSQGIKLVELVDGVCWGCVFFFFLISTQSYQGIKLVELVDGVCWGCVFFFLQQQQQQKSLYLGSLTLYRIHQREQSMSHFCKVRTVIDKPVELIDGVCWGCVFFFLISTQSYQGIKLVELIDELINGRVNNVVWGCRLTLSTVKPVYSATSK